MKKFLVEARTDNGVRFVTTVEAKDHADAELTAGRHFLELGMKGDSVKIHSVEER